jgi:uncharacterized protein YyaL (SSP411 family)
LRVRRLRFLAVLLALASTIAAAADAATIPPLPSNAQVTADRARFLKLAEDGLVQTRKVWWNPQKQWYMGRSNGDPPVASTWSAYPFLELVAAVAIAHPTKANKAFADKTFKQAEGYWDPTLGANGSGGVSWLYGLRNTGNAYFDDTGWWGVAYLDAYRATGNKRWLWDAGRALNFIDQFGWDRTSGGGTWWNVAHEHKTSEPLAAGALIAATLYRIQHKKYYLEIAKRYIAWADKKTRNPRQANLYGRSDTDGTVMDYVEGMMIGAHAELCVGTKDKSYCKKATSLANAALTQFPIDADWAPETDVVYIRWLLDLYERAGDTRWYSLAYRNAKRAADNARDDQGFWSLRWDRGYTLPGTLYTQSATLELLAFVAAVNPQRSTR